MPSSSDSGSDSSDSAPLPPNSLAGLSLSIFADLLSNLTHDIALQTHHTEKLLRTRQQALHPPTDGSPPPATTTANPLTVVPSEILCPRCHLPQHTTSTLDGPSGGAKKKFCPRLPWHNAPLHDIYGNPFPTIKDKNTKNGNGNGADKNNNNNNSYAATDSAAEDAPGTVVTGRKGATGAVYFKCTSCDNEKVLSSRYAAHLDKCLGLGRKSSRAAMAKMNSNSGSGSPMLSAVDAAGPKTGSRKPSPEKKSRSPVPGLNGTDEPAMVVVPPLPKSSFHTSSAVAANTTTTPTPKKKKKKAAAAAAAAALAAANAALPPPLPPPPSTPSKIDVPFIPVPPPATALVTAPQKKRKRKAEAAAAAAAATAAAAAAAAGDRQGSVVDDRDGSITLSATKPPPKRQKLSAERAEKAEKGEKMEKEKSMLGEGLPMKKSQVRNFKNGRGNSPSPGMGKKERRTSSPKPLASPPVTHKPLPPKPPVPFLGGPLGPAGSPPPASTPKSRKPKPGTLGGSARKSGEASVKKNAKPKMKKGMNAAGAGGSGAAGVGVGVGVGVGGAGAGKTVPRIAGKNPPGVARKGVKE